MKWVLGKQKEGMLEEWMGRLMQALGQGRPEKMCWGSGKPMEDPSRRAL